MIPNRIRKIIVIVILYCWKIKRTTWHTIFFFFLEKLFNVPFRYKTWICPAWSKAFAKVGRVKLMLLPAARACDCDARMSLSIIKQWISSMLSTVSGKLSAAGSFWPSCLCLSVLHYFHEFLERGEGEGGLEVKLHVWCWEGCCEQVSDK